MTVTTVTDTNLKFLIRFLNWPLEEIDFDEPKSKSIFERLLRAMTFGEGDRKQALKDLQQELRTNILELLDPSSSPMSTLNKLVKRINELRLTTFRSVVSPAERKEHENQFRIVDVIKVRPPKGQKRGRQSPEVKSFALVDHANNESVAESFYRILDEALCANTVSRIRNCLGCGRFFLRVGQRLTYCSDACQVAFNNKRRTESGYFKDKMQERRNPPKKKGSGPKKSLDAFIKKLISIEESDQDGKYLFIYKKLGGPQTGRKFITKLKGKTLLDIDAGTRQKLIELREQYPSLLPISG
jgi:hypothetical protein